MFINILFTLSSLLILSCCVLMVLTKNLVHSCMYLLGVLIGVAGLYVTLGADFIAVTQTMVYVGGVVILMLFAVMLTGGKDFISKTQSLLGLAPNMGNPKTLILGTLTGAVFVLTVYNIISSVSSVVKVNESLEFSSTVEAIGFGLMTDHVLAFEMSSVLLLGALVGAAIIARPRKEN